MCLVDAIGIVEDEECVELEQTYAIVELPKNTLTVEITAKVFDEEKSEVLTVSRKMTVEDVKHAMKLADENYIPDDAVFTLTESGREYAELLQWKNSEEQWENSEE